MKDKTFSYAKGLLESLGLNYKLPEGAKEEGIMDKIINETVPKYDSKLDMRLRLGDEVELVFEK